MKLIDGRGIHRRTTIVVADSVTSLCCSGRYLRHHRSFRETKSSVTVSSISVTGRHLFTVSYQKKIKTELQSLITLTINSLARTELKSSSTLLFLPEEERSRTRRLRKIKDINDRRRRSFKVFRDDTKWCECEEKRKWVFKG